MNIALILSGGIGTRLGTERPKQYIEVYGKPIIFYCIECILQHPLMDAVQIVADPVWHGYIEKWLSQIDTDIRRKFKGFVRPGNTRQLSVYNGLEAAIDYADAADYVFIHDAVRPMLTVKQITDCLEAARGHDGVLPVLPMKDTVYSSINGKTVASLLNRKEIYAGQAPEVFQLGKYYEANKRLLPDEILKINGSTEPAVMAGMDIVMINGDEGNFKITTKADLERFRSIIEERNHQRDLVNESLGFTRN